MVLHEAVLDGGDELGELALVLRAYLGEGQNSSSLGRVSRCTIGNQWGDTHLLVDDGSETGLALHNGIRNTHLLAKRRQEDNKLDRVDIVGDKDKRGLLVLDQANNVVETVLDSVRLLADVLLLLALLDSGGLLEKTLLLLRLGLGAVLVEELEGLGSGVLVENVLELGESWGNLEAHLEDLLLALKADILGPLHHAGDIALGLDVLADTEVTGALFDQGVLAVLAS
jgi:hypothetical protein